MCGPSPITAKLVPGCAVKSLEANRGSGSKAVSCLPGSYDPTLAQSAEELNSVTTSTTIPLLLSLLSGATLRTSIPGVAGLPGGYPFLLKQRKFSLRLPPGIALAEAIAHNKKGEKLDGLDLGEGAKFVVKARRALDAANFEYAQGFSFLE
jgi:hypothetical protein